jgi:peptidoglycan biosynthesis protein MviN/MurJ (putative lipid II flippase)
VEGLLVVWWGAARRLRVPFVIGLTASVINVLAQVVVLVRVYDVNRWIIIFGAGILLVGLGVFVERRREILLARAQEFRDTLERWD